MPNKLVAFIAFIAFDFSWFLDFFLLSSKLTSRSKVMAARSRNLCHSRTIASHLSIESKDTHTHIYIYSAKLYLSHNT